MIGWIQEVQESYRILVYRPCNGTKWMFHEYGQGPKAYDGIFLLAVTQALYYYISLGQITFGYALYNSFVCLYVCKFDIATSFMLMMNPWSRWLYVYIIVVCWYNLFWAYMHWGSFCNLCTSKCQCCPSSTIQQNCSTYICTYGGNSCICCMQCAGFSGLLVCIVILMVAVFYEYTYDLLYTNCSSCDVVRAIAIKLCHILIK